MSAASLVFHLPEWQAMGASPWALSVLRSGFRLVWLEGKPPLRRHPIWFPLPADPVAVSILDAEVQALSAKGATELVRDPGSPGFYCRLFAVTKATGGFRPVLDLSPLNRFLRHIPFRMDTPEIIRTGLRPGDWAVSLDLRDAYFHVPINPRDRKWLRFAWKDRIFQFRVLPFGLSQSPWVFTRIVREVIRHVRVQGLRVFAYLDDWLLLAATEQACMSHRDLLLRTAERLGFRVHPIKSDLEPSQTFTYLGMTVNTVTWTVAPGRKRLVALRKALASLMMEDQASLRQLASVLGQMESLALLLPLGRVYKRPLQRRFAALFATFPDQWDRRVDHRPWFREAVSQWLDEEWLSSSVPITLPAPEMEIFTDASMQGWGAHALDWTASGRWSPAERSKHINALELEAVALALQAFQERCPRGHLKVVSDNMTVVALINHQGGSHAPSLSMRVEQMLLWAAQKGWTLSARHLAGSVNVIADLLSRPGSIVPSEWTVCHEVLYPVWELWGKPHVDLFATRFSTRLQVFVSPVPDPRALAVDAFSLSWTGMTAYAFPPFALLKRVLDKALLESPRLILVAPLWPAMSWYPQLLDMAHGPPVELDIAPGRLCQPRSGVPHGSPQALALHAWLLCGRHCREPACRRRL